MAQFTLKMDKSKVNYVVDFMMFVFFILTSIAIFTRGFRGIHDFAGKVLVALIMIHLILHWNTIVCLTKNFFKKKEKKKK